MEDKIITVGLSPCWDRTIEIDGINFGQHKIISSQKISPAGKAFNINNALAWMGEETTAAGLWGEEDFSLMKKETANLKKYISIRFTKVPGRTRENITIIDTANKRQMHLRSKSTLANEKSMKLLKRDLQKIIIKHSFCIFSGAMPDAAIPLIEFAKKKAVAVVVDTSGPVLKKIVAKGGLLLIKPNVEELGEIIGHKIKNDEKEIISASKKILNKSKFILVSRGVKGALLMFSSNAPLTPESLGFCLLEKQNQRGKKFVYILSAKYIGKKYDVCSTVGCGDYLLAGFLSVLGTESPRIFRIFAPRKQKSEGVAQYNKQLCALALQSALKAATAKAFGLNEKLSWLKIEREITISMKFLIPES